MRPSDQHRVSLSTWWPVWLAVVVAVVLRLAWPSLRPIHHDEAVNWFLVEGVLREGFYDYDPDNYHGPLHYYVLAAFRLVLGRSLWVLRLPVMLAGVGVVPLVLLVRHRLGARGTAVAAWCLALSPAAVYYARDAIHETWLVLFTIALLGTAVRWWDAPAGPARRRWALASGASVGGLLVVKETAVITIAALALGGLAAWQTSGRPRVSRRGLLGDLGGAAAVAVGLSVALYSGFGLDPDGVLGPLSTLFIWGARGLEGGGHAKPVHHFVVMLARFELPVLVGAALGLVWALRRRDPFGVLLGVWAAASLLAYSAIPYKTPWTAINITLPLAMATGFLASRLELSGPRRVALAALAAVTSVGWLGWATVQSSFLRYDDSRLSLVYVQTHRQLDQLMQDLIALADAHPDPPLVFQSLYPARYPINWYLWQHELVHDEELTADLVGDVLFVSVESEARLQQRLGSGWVRREVRFRRNLPLVAYARADLGLALEDGWLAAEP